MLAIFFISVTDHFRSECNIQPDAYTTMRTEETFLQDILENLKRMPQIFKNILK